MAEAAPQYAIRIEIEKVSRGNVGGPNSIKQSVGNGITICTSTGAVNVEQCTNTVIEINDAQVTGLYGYIGLLKMGIDTSAIETAVATLVAAS
jgi:hypothetical protein